MQKMKMDIIDKERTPDSSSHEYRPRHTPTPKMSDRKKSLFISHKSKASIPLTINENSDSDLGPMSPLQFSCSPSESQNTVERYMENGSFFRGIERRCDFKNVIQHLNESPKSKFKRRPSMVSPDKQTNGSLTTKVTAIIHENADIANNIHDKENSHSNIHEKERVQQKTPQEPFQTKNVSAPRITHRKSLIFDTGLTPQNEISPKTKRLTSPSKSIDSSSKAKASLSFSDLKISPQSFYGTSSSINDSNNTQPSAYPIQAKRRHASLSPIPIVSRTHRSTTTKNVSQKKRHRKSTKFDLGRPKLGSVHKGCIHKITKPKPSNSHHMKLTKKKDTATSRWIEEATKIMMNSPLNAYLAKEKQRLADDSSKQQKDDDGRTKITLEQTKRLQEVLKNLKTTIDDYPLNWNVHGNAPTTSADDNEPKQSSESSGAAIEALAEEEREKQIEEEEKLSKRKFFKSNRNTVKGTYRLTNNLTATVKRGCTISLQSESPKKKKPKLSVADDDNYDEYLSIQQEISGIINMLNTANPQDICLDDVNDSSATETPKKPCAEENDKSQMITATPTHDITNAIEQTADDFRAMLPYNTDDPNVHRSQEYLLEMLISCGICTAETFKIFIAEKELHKAEAEKILNELYVVVDDNDENVTTWTMEDEELYDSVTVPIVNDANEKMEINSYSIAAPITLNIVDDNATLDTIDVPMSPASQISDLTSVLALESPKSPIIECIDNNVIPSSQPNINDDDASTAKLYPIFRKHATSSSSSNSNLTKSGTTTTNTFDKGYQNINSTKSEIRKWKHSLTADNSTNAAQLQIDAGQKKFGSITCNKCGMLYTLHEPEEEILHLKYHNSLNILQFKSWSNERRIASIHEWGVDGRIISVKDTDSKTKLNRVRDLLEKVIDNDLGYCIQSWKPMTSVYLAISKGQIIGACVAEPIKKAYRLVTENGVSVMDTTKEITVKCGISRIWVAPPFRRNSVATKLLIAVQIDYIPDYKMFLDEIAFSSPTNMGTLFAKKFNNGNVFVYDGF